MILAVAVATVVALGLLWGWALCRIAADADAQEERMIREWHEQHGFARW